tara:strand:+ start:1098 stop:1847 length:750 start_codon:yes stop_codon:yes gene_type:complete
MKLKINTMNEFKKIIGHEPYYGNPILPYSQENDFEELKNYFKDKTVAIVGPASELIGQCKGTEIDNHDIVCKLGFSYDIKDHENYGKKNDVIFSGCFPKYVNIHNLKNKNIKKVICPIKSCIPGIRDVHNRDLWKHYNYLKDNLKNIDFYNIGLLSCKFDNTYIGRATSGTFGLYFLLNMPIKSLSIYGMTWYKNKEKAYHPNYRNGNNIFSGGHGVSFDIEKSGIMKTIKNSNKKCFLNKEVYDSLYC